MPLTPSLDTLGHSLWSRRDALRVGALSIAATLLPARTAQAAVRKDGKARSVIFLWMAGGVSHIDGLDPKPDAPVEIRGTLGAIPTKVSGLLFNESLPCLARVADRLAVVRSYTSESDEHLVSQAYALSGRKVTPAQVSSEPNLGAVVSRLHGSRNSIPAYLAVPGALRPDAGHNLFVGGWLGPQYAPFAVGRPPGGFKLGTPQTAKNVDIEADLRGGLFRPADGPEAPKLDTRRRLRDQLEESARRVEKIPYPDAIDHHYRSAFDLLTAPRVRGAFDLDREPLALKERYGNTKLGRRCLLARRLVEAGARFVLVDYGYDPDYGNLWDTHCAPGQDPTPMVEVVKRPHHMAGLDRALAALISDLTDRGMLDETLVILMTEFGRTPKINKQGGRDHWGAAGSICFAGGGIRGGQAIGGTDKQGAYSTGRKFTPADVAATIFTAIGIDPHRIISDHQQRPIPILSTGEMIPGML
jgi:hypothetical protein